MKRERKTGRGVMRTTLRARQKRPEPRSGIVDSKGEVEKSSSFRAVFTVASEKQMTALQISLECNRYTCTEPKTKEVDGCPRPAMLVGEIFLGKEKKADVEVDLVYNGRIWKQGGFRVITSDPMIKRVVEEVGGKFGKMA